MAGAGPVGDRIGGPVAVVTPVVVIVLWIAIRFGLGTAVGTTAHKSDGQQAAQS